MASNQTNNVANSQKFATELESRGGSPSQRAGSFLKKEKSLNNMKVAFQDNHEKGKTLPDV
jgi:hypothetical protein